MMFGQFLSESCAYIEQKNPNIFVQNENPPIQK